MADKIPLKANYTGADVTSLGEFAASDTVPVANGGTGAATAADARTNLGAAALAGSTSQSFSMLNGTVAGTLSAGATSVSGDITATNTGNQVQLTAVSNSQSWSLAVAGTAHMALSGMCYLYNNTNSLYGFQVMPNGAVTIPGTLSLTGASSTLGYGPGAGGTVTQATSKSTAVTLNKPCGQITMNNAALAAGAVVSFSVNNSLFVSTYTVTTLIKDGIATNGSYLIWVDSGGAAKFVVNVKNMTGGSLAEAIVFNFAISTGAAS